MLSEKTFDAVSESRKWREVTSRTLDAMNESERLKYLWSVAEALRKEMRSGRSSGDTERIASSAHKP